MPYVDPEIIAEVKRVDLLTYLQEREPDELVRISPGVYCTKEHDSLKISNGKWFWWSRDLGGRSALAGAPTTMRCGTSNRAASRAAC